MASFNYIVFVSFIICFFNTVSCDNNFRPTFYELSLDFSKFSTDATYFDGEAKIYFNFTQTVYGIQQIALDAEMLNITDISIIDSSNRKIELIKSYYSGNTYIIVFKLILNATELITTITYKGQIGDAGDTGVFVTNEKNIIATNSYPEGVRKIFPCVNDPSIRTSYKVDVKLVNNKWGIHHVTDGVESPVIPAHAFGFIMTLHYRKVDDVSTDRFNVWVPRSDQHLYDRVNNNKILKDVLARGTYFYNFFNSADLDKIHIVMVPGIKLLSVINHRLISIRPDVIVTEKNETAEMAKATAVSTLNAISKHFFRCVVTPNKWKDFWLSDSLALYLQYALLDNSMFHGYNFPDLFMLELQRPAMRGSPIPVNPTSVDTSILISDNVFPPAYQGASILKMLEPLSSKKEILQDLINYYNQFVYQGTNTDQFLNFMTKGSMFKQLNNYGKNLKDVLDKWIHDVGYPYLTDISITKDGFTLNQQAFYGSESKSEWIIPFVYTDVSDKNGSLQWLTGNKNEMYQDTDIGPWIQLNKNSKGMFRVNYGDILDKLSKDKFYWTLSGTERAALIDDSFALSWREKPIMEFGSVLELFDKLYEEKEYTPFVLTMNLIDKLRHFYSQMGLASQFDLKIGELIYNTYEKINWHKQKSVNIGEAMWTRSVAEKTCDYSISTCQFDAGRYSFDMSSILKDLIPTINCQIVRGSLQTDWSHYFFQLYNNESSQYARADALYALACPSNLGDSPAITEYLNMINSDAILLEDSQRAFSSIYARPEHVNQTLNYINSRFNSLNKRFGDDFMAALINDITKLLLPNYFNILDNIRSQTSTNSKTRKAIDEAKINMKVSYTIVNSNLYQMAYWLHTNTTTFSPLPPTTPSKPHTNGSSVYIVPCITVLIFIVILQIYNEI